MSLTTRNTKIETLAWITDDEAEFWTSTTPIETKKTFHYFSTSKKNSSSDDLHYKTNKQLNSQIEDPLSLSYKQLIEKQAKEVSENAEKTKIFEKFQLEENGPEINMGFLDRLFHSSSKPPISEKDYLDDEVFTEIDESEIMAVINNNADIDVSSNVENKSTDNIPFINDLKSFIDELGEEKDVIMGTIDEETLFNRRSRKTKSLPAPPIKNDDISFSRTSY
ncbi:unnamed protein product [Rotaria sordida]|uniref:Uncharacterized protein n=1 Tax=Rotaria sordida TaxID=392033 RepID=A0A814MDI7_9BILA|nr:unnamed protein product [Rotaria sordida]